MAKLRQLLGMWHHTQLRLDALRCIGFEIDNHPVHVQAIETRDNLQTIGDASIDAFKLTQTKSSLISFEAHLF